MSGDLNPGPAANFTGCILETTGEDHHNAESKNITVQLILQKAKT
jgi:hypothetical protein